MQSNPHSTNHHDHTITLNKLLRQQCGTMHEGEGRGNTETTSTTTSHKSKGGVKGGERGTEGRDSTTDFLLHVYEVSMTERDKREEEWEKVKRSGMTEGYKGDRR